MFMDDEGGRPLTKTTWYFAKYQKHSQIFDAVASPLLVRHSPWMPNFCKKRPAELYIRKLALDQPLTMLMSASDEKKLFEISSWILAWHICFSKMLYSNCATITLGANRFINCRKTGKSRKAWVISKWVSPTIYDAINLQLPCVENILKYLNCTVMNILTFTTSLKTIW